jgi:hypothetical protein
MSRSRRHYPVIQACSHTQKEWKRTYNRALRHLNKIRTKLEKEPLEVRDVSDIWTSPSDGWMSFWSYWSERRTLFPCRFSTPEENAEYDEHLKQRVFRK